MMRLALSIVAAVVALAGCAGVQETAEPSGLEQRVAIDGGVYECDDVFDADGICDEYELVEGAQATPDMAQGSRGASGNVEVDGNEYECDDRVNVDVDANGQSNVGACEEYEWVEQ